MDNNMEKLAEVLQQVPAMLRMLAQEVEAARAQSAEFEKRAKAENLVAEMEARGLADPNVPRQEKVAALLNSGKDLDVLAQAVQMQIGDLSPVNVDATGGEGQADALSSYLISG